MATSAALVAQMIVSLLRIKCPIYWLGLQLSTKSKVEAGIGFFQGDGKFARSISKEGVEEFLMDALVSEAWTGQGGFQLAEKSKKTDSETS